MKLQSLTIGLRCPYSAPGPNNRYIAKLDISYNDNRMTVALSDETCRRILKLAGSEIAAAAQVQIAEFVTEALSINSHEMLELEAQPQEGAA